jgi:spore germination protein YaaH
LSLRPGPSGSGSAREVFGYLPYWELDKGIDAYLRYDLLTTIAFFGIGYASDGHLITDAPGYRAYMGDLASTVIRNARAAGVRTVITFQSFDRARNEAFLSDPEAQATFIEEAVALMEERGADGANVDIEGLSGTFFDAYGAFVGSFARAAKERDPDAEISVATNGNTSGAKMAAAALAGGADRAFIMGYNYRTAGSARAGSVAPLVREDGLSLTSTLTLYAAAGVPLDRVILGLPYYGRTWPTTSDELHAPRQTDTATYGSAKAFFPRTLPASARGSTETYDPVEHAVVLARYDEVRGTWVQTYYDDPRSLRPKMQLAVDSGLAGIGMWALGYDRGQPGYWELIAEMVKGPRPEAGR